MVLRMRYPIRWPSPRAAANARNPAARCFGAERQPARGGLALALRRLTMGMFKLLPIATTVLAALLSIEPLHIGGYATLTPAFTLMATYHWTIYRPDLLSALSLFVIGSIQDLLSDELPGMTALSLLLARATILSYRRHFVNRP